jgi:hypothetical protein
MDKNPDASVPAQLNPGMSLAPPELAEKFDESRNESAPRSNLQERLQNWGSD